MKKFFLTIFFAVYFLLPTTVSAEITYPYTVDEKARVLFGDSVQVGSYYGLENYTHDYVNGYLHITFTYTHNSPFFGCCSASFPPRLYITDVDPRSTATSAVKANNIIYHLHLIEDRTTDWHLYDIQFDATGYRWIVRQSGVTEILNLYLNTPGLADTDWAALANEYLLPASEHSMSFTPLPIRENIVLPPPPEPTTPDPIIIIPGIMGSAYKNGALVIDPILHTYDDLIATLAANGYTEGTDLFTFPYEWRDSNVFSANLLDDKIEEVKAICECNKVDLVAHSMGGLVARSYIQSVDYDQDVDQLIFLGTPHKGSPKAYLQWEGGKFEPKGLDNILTELFFEGEALRNGYSTIFNYIRNRPILSVQELLPTFDYLKDKSTGIIRTYPTNYPQNNFLQSLNNNISSLLNSRVRLTNIVGNAGSNTIEKIRVVPSAHTGLWEHGEPDGFYTILGDKGLEIGLGDNTVTVAGATLDSAISNQEVSSTHQRIPTVAEAKVFNTLTGKTATTTYDNGIGLDTKVLLLQLLSPIDVVITAPDGKKIGKNFSTGAEYAEIPGAFYSGYQTDAEFITILNPQDGEYKVEVQGTGTGGGYGVLTSYVSDATSTSKQIAGLTEAGQVTTLNVRVDNANPGALAPQRMITSEVLLNDILKAYQLGWITDKRLKDSLLRQAKRIIKTDVAGRTIDRKVARALLTELKGYEAGKMNEQAYNIIKEDLEWLINN